VEEGKETLGLRYVSWSVTGKSASFMTACRQLGWAKGSLGSSYVFFILPPYLSTSSSMFPSLLECEVQQLMLMLFSSIRCTCLVNQCQRQLKTVWFYGLPHKDNTPRPLCSSLSFALFPLLLLQ